MGGKQDKDINQVKTPPIFRINGQNYHRIGSLLPRDGGQPKFLQMYLCDPSEETSNRLKAVSFKIKNSISVALRSKGQIVLNVASSGIASLLLPGGRTAHSRFAIPLDATEDSTCHIKHGSPLARLIERTRLIIWDESPMTHRYCFEALDRSMRDVLRYSHDCDSTMPFGGKTVVFGGDFRQILPVIPKGTRQNIVQAAMNSSFLWSYCRVLKLTKNMRLGRVGGTSYTLEIQNFAEWILKIGDGVLGDGDDGESMVDIPEEFIAPMADDPIEAIVKITYPDFEMHCNDVSYLNSRAILAPTIDERDMINDYMLGLTLGEVKTYLSSDSASSDSDSALLQEIHSPEFLNTIKCSGVPSHELKLKVGAPVMLMRNIDHPPDCVMAHASSSLNLELIFSRLR
ncbi:unnamed protein product [Cuscuta epithymum]|uniref:ATP-dependent DNA helicase n=1 Tax=Cuscuta epithymum TaxID=186058 RepID=A0AAV0DJ25_9ASTE|nr:unnamed protein product [Cuscuta epithymum]